MPRARPQGSELLASLPISKRFKPRKSGGGGGGEARRRRRRRRRRDEKEEEEEEEERRGGGEGGGGAAAEHEGRWEPGNQKQTLHQGVVKNNKMVRKGRQVPECMFLHVLHMVCTLFRLLGKGLEALV